VVPVAVQVVLAFHNLEQPALLIKVMPVVILRTLEAINRRQVAVALEEPALETQASILEQVERVFLLALLELR
jgi:hypothetical protein